MPKAQKLQTNFTKGELSPQIEGRPDLAAFYNGCKILENFLIFPEGGIFRRTGTRMVKETKDSTKKSIAIPFKFNISQAYAIEVGHFYFRFYRRNSGTNVFERIEDPPNTPIEVATPYTESDLKEIQWTQSADVLYLVDGAHQQRKLSRLSDTSWVLSLFNPNPPPSYEADTNLAEVAAPAANTGNAIHFYAKSAIFLAADVGRQIISGAGRAIIKTFVSAVEITADIIDAFAATITAGPGTVTTVGTALTSSIAHGLAADNYVTLTAGAQAGEIRRVTVIGGATTATLDAAFTVDQGVGVAWNKVIGIASGSWTLRGSPQTTLDPNKKEPKGTTVALVAGADAFRVGDVGKYIKVYGGLIKLTIYTGVTQMTGEILSPLTDATLADPPAAPAGSWTLEVADWSDARGWPSSVEFHQGRLWFAGSASRPTTMWGSVSDDFESFAIGSLAANAVEYTIANRSVNVIEWLKSLVNLFIGDAENEHSAKGPGIDQPLGGDVIPLVRDQSAIGSMSTMAQAVSDALVFVQAYGRKVFQLAYDLTRDAFAPKNLCLFSRHIGDSVFAQHPPVFQKEPNSILYFIRSDGQMPALTYYRDEEVTGWSRWKTKGLIESACSIPNRTDGFDDLVLIVNRTINGAMKRFIEIIEAKDLNVVSRAWRQLYTDCAVSGKTGGAPTSTIGGLSHLVGETVQVVINQVGAAIRGSYKGDYVVSAGGTITLPENIPANTEYEVGLAYTSTLKTMRPSIEKMMVEGLMRRWVKCFLRLKDSIGARVNGKDMDFDVGGQAMDQGPALFTGDKAIPTLGSDLDGYITVEQILPYPLTILSMFGEVEFGDTM